jgi:hypothetical protein
MVDTKLAQTERVACAVCQKDIPKDAALHSEDQDYVLFFCGLDCYDEWARDAMAVKLQEAGEAE